LLTIDRQMGLNVVHPKGKVYHPLPVRNQETNVTYRQPAKTIFNRVRYDADTDTSVLRCTSTLHLVNTVIHTQVKASRSQDVVSSPIPRAVASIDGFQAHQIRVHLQYLGHPIANDPIYSETKIWVGTVDLACSPMT
jgi:tRNA pseudouridine32 synthase